VHDAARVADALRVPRLLDRAARLGEERLALRAHGSRRDAKTSGPRLCGEGAEAGRVAAQDGRLHAVQAGDDRGERELPGRAMRRPGESRASLDTRACQE
jgi:hypothetical protein